MKGKKTSQKNKKNNRKNNKTKKGGWYDIYRNHKSDDEPFVYRLFNEKRNLPVDENKRFAELPKKIDLRNYTNTKHNVEDEDEHESLRVDKYDDEDDEYETWRDVNEDDTEITKENIAENIVEDRCADLPEGCNLSTINNLQESTWDGWLDSGKILKLSAMLAALNYSEKKDGSELVMVNTNMEKQWGNKDCSELRKKIEDNYKLIYEFKHCAAFKKIVDFKIYQHNFKKEHLSIIPLTFNIFPNIQSITFGVDEESFTLTPEEKQCLEKKEKVKFDIQDGKYGKEIVVNRANILGGKKRRTLKVLQKHKRRLFKNRRTRNNKIV